MMPSPVSQLCLGQTVRPETGESGYQLTIVSGDQPGQKIVEVGRDYIVLDDPVEGVQTRIPTFFITAVNQPQAESIAQVA